MASSDDEGEAVPHIVSNYHFVDDKNEPTSFSKLPVQWNEAENLDGKKKRIFLHGNTDNGRTFKQVTAWKFDLSYAKPEMSVLSKENNWIVLQKPRKSFEDTVRTILITVHCLHILKKNPETSGRALWNHLPKFFGSYEARPSENDLVDQMNLIREAVKRDEVLARSKFLVTFLEQNPRERKAFDKDVEFIPRSGFIVDDDMIDVTEEDGSDEEGDSICTICDNGGDLLCCEGSCLRSFHATVKAGSDSKCKSLCLSNEQLEAIPIFFCKNCQYKQHQCFSCGQLGSSDKSSGAEVFPCVSAICGHFYHPHCAAKLLHRESETEAKKLQKKIAAGEAFMCPVHKCYVCKQGENKMDPELQFAICRRCPKSYHRKCLPRKISFKDIRDEGIVQRAWKGLIPNRILIYCLKHKIDDKIQTPMRNHIKFPNVGQKKKRQASELLSSSKKVAFKERGLASEDDASRKRTVVNRPKGSKKLSSAVKQGDFCKKSEGIVSGPESSKKQKLTNTSRKPSNKTSSTKVIKLITDESRTSLGEGLYALLSKDSEPVKSMKDNIADGRHEKTETEKPVAKEMSNLLPLEANSRQRLDEKEPPYDLGWEDDELLAGKSFYLPGSVGATDKQLDEWNVSSWSCPDWTSKHEAISEQHDHLSRVQEEVENRYEVHVSDFPMEDHDEPLDDAPVQNEEPEQLQVDSSWASTRLDELSDTRMNSVGSQAPSVDRSCVYDASAPRVGFRVESLGFASGPWRPSSQNSSSGWLIE